MEERISTIATLGRDLNFVFNIKKHKSVKRLNPKVGKWVELRLAIKIHIR